MEQSRKTVAHFRLNNIGLSAMHEPNFFGDQKDVELARQTRLEVPLAVRFNMGEKNTMNVVCIVVRYLQPP